MSGATIEFSEQDLQDIADSYDPKVHEAPLVVGHPKDKGPAYWSGPSFVDAFRVYKARRY